MNDTSFPEPTWWNGTPEFNTEPDDDRQRYEHEMAFKPYCNQCQHWHTDKEPHMASIDDVFAGDSLRAADIKGKEPTVIIQSVEVREFTSKEGKKQSKLVIYFQGAKKTLICNKTNANRIAYMHGKDYTRWPGKKITLFVDPFVEFGGQQTEAIRVKPPTYAAPAPQAPQSPDELLPAVEHPFSDDVPF